MSHAPQTRNRRAGGELRRVASVGLVLVVLLAAMALVAPGVEAQPAAIELELVLVDQTVEFGPDGDIELVYEVVGDLAAAGLTPPTTVPPTTTTTTTTTRPPDDGDPADDTAPADDTDRDAEPDPPPAPEPVLPELRIDVRNYEAIDDPSDVVPLIGADPPTALLPDVIDGVGILEVRPLVTHHEDGVALLTITVGTDRGVDTSVADRLRFDEPGIHPIGVELLVDGTVAARHGTVVDRLDRPARRRPVVDLGVIGAVADPGPTATDAELASAVAGFEALVATAGELDAPITLAAPPQVVAAATDDPDDAARIAEQLADDELLALPAVPFDVSSAAAADRVDAFLAQLAAGEEILIDALPSVPVRRDVWLAVEPLSGPGAQVLRDAGVRHVVATGDGMSALLGEPPERTDRFVEFDLPGGGTMPVIPIDDELGDHLTGPPEDALDDLTPTEWTVATNAEVRLDVGDERRETSRVVAGPDLGAFDPTLLQLLATGDVPSVRFTAVSALTGVTDAVAAPVELPPRAGPDLESRVDQLAAAELELASASSMLGDDDPRPEEWTRRLGELVATGYPREVVDATVDELRAEADRLRGAVVPPQPFTFTLTGSSGDIELRIGNTLDEPVRVLLQLSSPRLAFPEGDEVVELAPGTTVVRIPVRARSNGTSSVSVEILTPLGESIAEPIDLTSRVTALTGLGPVLTGGLVLVLLSWWFSHWRRRRRDEADTTDDTDDTDTDHADDTDHGDRGGRGDRGDHRPRGARGAPGSVPEAAATTGNLSDP